jgi:GlpG protein
MLLMYQLGSRIEESRGSLKLLLLVVACAMPSNVAQYYLGNATWDDGRLIPSHSPFFGGMSGVVYGLFGYLWMKALFEPELGMHIQPSNIALLMIWFFLCMSKDFQEIAGRVANLAHAGGLFMGVLIGIMPTVVHLLFGWLWTDT